MKIQKVLVISLPKKKCPWCQQERPELIQMNNKIIRLNYCSSREEAVKSGCAAIRDYLALKQEL